MLEFLARAGMVVLVLGAALALWAAWQMYRFPGSTEQTFGEEWEDQRAALTKRRAAVKALERRRKSEQANAAIGVRRAKAAHRRRCETIRSRIASLRASPGRGELVQAFGPVELYEHQVVVDGAALPLGGLQATAERMLVEENQVRLTVTAETGQSRMTCYEVPTTPELDLHRFAAAINARAVNATQAAADRRRELERAEEELQAAQEDTDDIDAALARQEDLSVLHAADTKLPAARRALDDELESWEESTGRRPPA